MTRRHTPPPAGVRLAGTGMAVPTRRLTNHDLAKIVDTNDEWITQRTGIKSRARVSEGEKTSDLAAQAVQQALENAGMTPDELDLLICATMTPDMICPATAAQVVAKLGAVPCGAFDLNIACTGLVAAINTANNFIASGACENVAVVGAEVLSSVVNWDDRRTCVLFGDGAGAAVLTASDDSTQGCLYQRLSSDGNRGNSLYVPRTEKDIPPGEEEAYSGKLNTLQMNGKAVYKFAVTTLADCVAEALDATGLTAADIKMVIPHQSNIRMLQSAWKRLGFDQDKVYINIDRFGNTSAASVGICLHELMDQGRLDPGDHVIFVAQGGGLSWGTSLWRL
ncbi:beta-ketoacyl-ACP synthase III [Phycisphaerales bacterium AB-hyl4]|uniref:Beta-ketoacyl-[acyl-carrier-protein] synthase III n=1 Tax=Natronomicrosphaera hydrolytica TaxID=3242702 RepID=A0ABV4U1T3_9BACT